MIWGESGGGAKTSALTAMPSAKGLFHRASIESGPTLRLRSRDSANATADAVLAALGLSKAQARDVTVGYVSSQFSQITKGLEAGELVVTQKPQDLKDGQPVKVIEVQK